MRCRKLGKLLKSAMLLPILFRHFYSMISFRFSLVSSSIPILYSDFYMPKGLYCKISTGVVKTNCWMASAYRLLQNLLSRSPLLVRKKLNSSPETSAESVRLKLALHRHLGPWTQVRIADNESLQKCSSLPSAYFICFIYFSLHLFFSL